MKKDYYGPSAQVSEKLLEHTYPVVARCKAVPLCSFAQTSTSWLHYYVVEDYLALLFATEKEVRIIRDT